MISASVDIGTNTVLLLVADVKKHKIHILEEKQRIPRLGKKVDRTKALHPDSIQRTLEALTEYKQFLEQKYPGVSGRTIVTATSAVRDASNKNEFLNLVHRETSWHVQLLSGHDEAKTTYRGALTVLNDWAEKTNLILDIGGGSTELAFGTGYKLEGSISINMGSVRFTERFFKNDPPAPEQIEKARSEIQKLLYQNLKKRNYTKENKETLQDQSGFFDRQSELTNPIHIPENGFGLIGVAGTVTSVAAISQNLNRYSREKLNGYLLFKTTVERFIDEFSVTSSEEIEQKYPMFLKGRGEVILAGLLILKEVMDKCGMNAIVTSTGGIRHGMLLNR